MHEQNCDRDPTRRFSSRVADYVRYRPAYPAEIIGALRGAGVLRPGSEVADVGSGTGLLSRLFLAAGYAVRGIEPNPDMRRAGEEQLREFAQFTSIDGTAEATTLAKKSVDVVTAGQAFHWFDREKTKLEFQRILQADSRWVVLVWNERRVGATAFLEAYEELLREFSTDYAAVDHRQMTPEILAAFYAPGSCQMKSFGNQQIFDLAGVRGRLLSSSYAPGPGHPRHEAMVGELARIFEKHQENGRVVFEYDTEVYFGELS
ncbi:MAG TPA: class I SAM-dependent methyltransferase [Phycisphaerae bacterium]